jgi:hypothetical protein
MVGCFCVYLGHKALMAWPFPIVGLFVGDLWWVLVVLCMVLSKLCWINKNKVCMHHFDAETEGFKILFEKTILRVAHKSEHIDSKFMTTYSSSQAGLLAIPWPPLLVKIYVKIVVHVSIRKVMVAVTEPRKAILSVLQMHLLAHQIVQVIL